MKKRIMSLVLALVMCMGLAAPAFAVVEQNAVDASQLEEPLYERHTIEFDASAALYSLDGESDTQANIEAAKEYVRSLNLSEQGFDYIEESCLSQLEGFSEIEDFSLESYTVLTPKNVAATPQYYDTYKGFRFYTADYSEYVSMCKTKPKYAIGKMDKQTLYDFFNEVVNWGFTLFGNQVTCLAYTTLCDALGALSTDYIIFDGDMIEEIYKIDPTIARGIYTKSGPNNSFVRYYSSERGTCYAQIVYYSCMPGTPGATTIDFDPVDVTMPNYDNKTYQMEQAYNWIMYAGTEYPYRKNVLVKEVPGYCWS